MVPESLHSPGMLRPQQERGSRALGWADNLYLVLLVMQGTLARLPTPAAVSLHQKGLLGPDSTLLPCKEICKSSP